MSNNDILPNWSSHFPERLLVKLGLPHSDDSRSDVSSGVSSGRGSTRTSWKANLHRKKLHNVELLGTRDTEVWLITLTLTRSVRYLA